MICFETMNCFILCGQRETRSYLFLTQRWSNGLATLCSVIRKVLTLKMILCRLFCMSSTAAGNVRPGMEYWPKHCVGSANDWSFYRAEVHWKPTDILCLRCHLSLWNQFQWHFSISLECYYTKKYWKDLVKEVCLKMSLTPKIVESNLLDLVRVHLVKHILRVRKIDVWLLLTP